MFHVLKVKELIAIKNDMKIKSNLFIIIFFKLRFDFVSKVLKMSYMFAVQIPDGKKLKMFSTTVDPICYTNTISQKNCLN